MSSFYKHITGVTSYPKIDPEVRRDAKNGAYTHDELVSKCLHEKCSLCGATKPDTGYFDTENIELICVTHLACEQKYSSFVSYLRKIRKKKEVS